jgi:hypothetical protein
MRLGSGTTTVLACEWTLVREAIAEKGSWNANKGNKYAVTKPQVSSLSDLKISTSDKLIPASLNNDNLRDLLKQMSEAPKASSCH